MINIENAKRLFLEYVRTYDFEHDKINLKYYHTLRVMEFCKKIAIDLMLSDQDIALAQMVGLLHDIGRFEQVKVYDTFDDSKSFDHALYGVDVLLENQYLDLYVPNTEEQKIVIEAIRNHSAYAIATGLDDRTQLFCNIIRDADKLDILELMLSGRIMASQVDEEISSQVRDCFDNMRLIRHADCKNLLDRMLLKISFCYDFNFKYSFEYVQNRQIMGRIIDQLIETNINEKEMLTQIKEKVESYIERKVLSYDR